MLEPPAQAAVPPVVAVTTYATESGAVPALNKVSAGIVFVPLGVKPVIVAELLVQLYVTPAVVELNVTALELPPEQIVCFGELNVSAGEGLTVMV